ncbi:MAG: metallophosphoesterase [Phycisphaerae bacterium]
MAWPTIRIVHLSDLHLTGSEDAARSEPKLFGKLTGMNAAFRQVLASKEVQNADRILITGDITDTGALAEWRIFWNAVAGLAKERLILVPGNHDVCCLGLRVVLPGSLAARRDWAKYVVGVEVGGSVPEKRGYPAVVEVTEAVAVFVLNSNNLGNISGATNAIGEVAYFDLVRLAELLYQHRHTPVKIVALHHSPNIPEAATARRRGQTPMSDLGRLTHQIPEDQRRALRLLCLSHRVRLMAHGHLHQKEDRDINGIRIIGAPATTQPVTVNKKWCYPFWQYEIAGKAQRIRHQLVTVPVDRTGR